MLVLDGHRRRVAVDLQSDQAKQLSGGDGSDDDGVVGPEISFTEIYSYFPENFQNDFTRNFLPLKSFQITAFAYNDTFKGFHSTCFV